MADPKAQQDLQTGTIEANEFDFLLRKEFKPKTDEAKEAVERAVRTLAEQALAQTRLISTDVVKSIEAIIAQIDKKLTEQINLILHHEDIGQIPVVSLRPQVGPIRSGNELRGHSNARAGLAHAAFQNVCDSKRLRDAPRIRVLALERKSRRARDHLQAWQLIQRMDDLFRQTVAEVFLLGIGAEIREG